MSSLSLVPSQLYEASRLLASLVLSGLLAGWVFAQGLVFSDALLDWIEGALPQIAQGWQGRA